jgi:hypothetical protein
VIDMGGLFGGGGGSSETKHKQELNPPVDTSGSSIPGDDKMALRKLETMTASKEAKASQTLLGRSANEASMGTAKPTSQVTYR